MLQTDLAAATEVYNNPNASQAEIDAACTKLQTTLTLLDEHKFVLPVVTMTAGDKTVTNSMTFETVNGVLNIDVAVAGNMYKSLELATDNENNVTSVIGDKSIALTKTGDNATVTVSARVVDNYDRETTYTYNITLVDKLVYITSIYMTLNGEKVTSVNKSGYKIGYRDFTSFKLEYKTDEVGAANPVSVEWKSTNSEYITVDNEGNVNITMVARAKQINTTNIICTVTNADGSTATVKIPVTIQR